MNVIRPEELNVRLAEGQPPALLHVLPEEVFAAQRIPESLNACIYEIAFLEQVAGMLPDQGQEIVVYGADGGSKEAGTAAERMAAAGYGQVAVLEGGLQAWAAAGLELEGHGQLPGGLPDRTYAADVKSSILRWTGRNRFNHHHGTVRLASGQLEFSGGVPKAARLEIDMDSIACEDIEDSAMNALLIRHLKHADFFEVARHPRAVFVLESAESLEAAHESAPNFRMHGQFTLRGVTRPLAFEALLAADGEGNVTVQGVVDLDRTEYGSHYGSGRFFRFLGKHAVNDVIHLHVKAHFRSTTA